MKVKQADRLIGVPMSKTRIIFAECARLAGEGVDVTALTLGEPDFDTPEFIKESCKKALDEGHTKYTDNIGILPLRIAICDKLKRENGLDYDPQEIIATTGVAQGMFAAMLSFLNPGDEVLIPDPVYLTYSAIPKIAGAEVKRYKLLEENNFNIDVKQIESLISEKTRMIAIVSPNNPTGSVLKRADVEALADIAKKHDLLVLSDEIYERLTYSEENPHIIIASLPGMKERTILLNGLSKSMAMTGWRLGYIAADEKLIDPLNRMCFYMTAGATSFVQEAAVTALSHDEGSVEKMRSEFKKRRDFLFSYIDSTKNFSCVMPEGAFYVFMNIKRTGMSSDEFCEYALEKHQLAFIPGDAFGECGQGYVRISYAASMDKLRQAMDKLAKIDREISEDRISVRK